MEYLMSYSWAILMIAVVLGALYTFGVFNTLNYAPRAPPGSCSVQRPYGVGSISLLSLQGECSGTLPQYTMYFNGKAYVKIPVKAALSTRTNWTWSAWVYESNGGADAYAEGNPSVTMAIAPNAGSLRFALCAADCWQSTVMSNSVIKANLWQYIVITFANGTAHTGNLIMYVNGKYSNSFTSEVGSLSTYQLLGGEDDGAGPVTSYVGYLSNLQLYSTPLTANQYSIFTRRG